MFRRPLLPGPLSPAIVPSAALALFLALLLAACEPTGQAGPDSAASDRRETGAETDQETAAMTAEETDSENDTDTDTETGAASPSSDPLTGSRWLVEDLSGGGVIDRARTTVEFVEPGRVAGRGGCNRYMGGYALDGASLDFAPLASTMMACPEALMNQERRFFDAMEQVRAWRIDSDTDLLHLLDEAGETVVRASRLEEDAEADVD